MLVKIYLPEEATGRATVIEDLMSKYKKVTINQEPDTKKWVAECLEVLENKQYEIHPTTGLPILLD